MASLVKVINTALKYTVLKHVYKSTQTKIQIQIYIQT